MDVNPFPENNVANSPVVVNCSLFDDASIVKKLSPLVGVTLEYSVRSIFTVTVPELPPPLSPSPATIFVTPPIEN